MAPSVFNKRCLNKSRSHIFLPRRERIIACLLNQTQIAGLVGGRFPSELAGPGFLQDFLKTILFLCTCCVWSQLNLANNFFDNFHLKIRKKVHVSRGKRPHRLCQEQLKQTEPSHSQGLRLKLTFLIKNIQAFSCKEINTKPVWQTVQMPFLPT